MTKASFAVARGLITEGRTCGTCYACCTWLGIEELRKWTGQACKHLDGAVPTARCSIYASRPMACREYKCIWLQGFGPEELKPSASGMLLTAYADGGADSYLGAAVTIIIFDYEKAKPLIDNVVASLLAFEIEVRAVDYHKRSAILYKSGNIYRCRILPPEGFESLIFEAEDPPVGTYLLKQDDEPPDESLGRDETALPSRNPEDTAT